MYWCVDFKIWRVFFENWLFNSNFFFSIVCFNCIVDVVDGVNVYKRILFVLIFYLFKVSIGICDIFVRVFSWVGVDIGGVVVFDFGDDVGEVYGCGFVMCVFVLIRVCKSVIVIEDSVKFVLWRDWEGLDGEKVVY